MNHSKTQLSVTISEHIWTHILNPSQKKTKKQLCNDMPTVPAEKQISAYKNFSSNLHKHIEVSRKGEM